MKALLLKLFFCLPVSLLAQFKMVNTEFINPDTCVLYAGVDNDLTVIGRNDLNGFRIVSSKNSTISIEKNRISILPAYNNGVDTLSIFRNKKLVFSRGYNIVKLEDPSFQFGGSFDKKLRLNQILANPVLIVKFRNSLYQTRTFSQILSFSSSIHVKGYETQLFVNLGNSLSSEAMVKIKTMHPGDVIVLDDIKAGCAGGDTRQLQPRTITIK